MMMMPPPEVFWRFSFFTLFPSPPLLKFQTIILCFNKTSFILLIWSVVYLVLKSNFKCTRSFLKFFGFNFLSKFFHILESLIRIHFSFNNNRFKFFLQNKPLVSFLISFVSQFHSTFWYANCQTFFKSLVLMRIMLVPLTTDYLFFTHPFFIFCIKNTSFLPSFLLQIPLKTCNFP